MMNTPQPLQCSKSQNSLSNPPPRIDDASTPQSWAESDELANAARSMESTEPVSPITSDFMTTLQEAEKTHHATTIAALFSPNATLQVMTSLMPNTAPASSAEEFWRRYLLAFRDISSRFTHVTEARPEGTKSGQAIIEWTSRGTLMNGKIVKYNGVSIFEHDGEAITTFRTYFDSAALLPEAPRTTHTHSHSVGMPEIGSQISS